MLFVKMGDGTFAEVRVLMQHPNWWLREGRKVENNKAAHTNAMSFIELLRYK